MKATRMLAIWVLTLGLMVSVANGDLTLPYHGVISTDGKAFWVSNAYAGTGLTYGGFFYAAGIDSRGVFGQSDGSSGMGVKGWAKNSGDVENYGGHFTSTGERGIGVYGWAENAGDVQNYGGFFLAEGNRGIGLFAMGGPNGLAGEFAGDVMVTGAGHGIVFPDGTKQTTAGGGGDNGAGAIALPYSDSGFYYEGALFQITNRDSGMRPRVPGPIPLEEPLLGSGVNPLAVGSGEELCGILGRYTWAGPPDFTPDYNNAGMLGGNNFGVKGICEKDEGCGVYGESGQGIGVYGKSTAGGYGIKGVAQGSGAVEPHYGGYFEGEGDYGCGILAKAGAHGYAADLAGPVRVQNGQRFAYMCDYDDNDNKVGVWGGTDTGKGVAGYSTGGYGVYGYSKTGNGVRGSSPDGYAGAFFGRFRLADLPGIAFGVPLMWEGTTTANGDVGWGVSSVRFKENIEPLEDDFHKILKAEPKSFTPKGRSVKGIGFIAEEFDELGLGRLLIYQDGKPLSIRYDLISLYLLEVLKDQVRDAEELKENQEALEAQVGSLTRRVEVLEGLLRKQVGPSL